jgi:Tetratricopeptide repeat
VASAEYPVAAQMLNESAALWEQLGNQGGTARVLHNLAHLEGEQGNYERATALYE